MFSQTEDFERCPKCNNPYFEKNIKNVINKVPDRNKQTPVLVTKKITSFKCTECNYLLSEFIDESLLEKYS